MKLPPTNLDGISPNLILNVKIRICYTIIIIILSAVNVRYLETKGLNDLMAIFPFE